MATKLKIGEKVIWGDTICFIKDILGDGTQIKVGYNSNVNGKKATAYSVIHIDCIKDLKHGN